MFVAALGIEPSPVAYETTDLTICPGHEVAGLSRQSPAFISIALVSMAREVIFYQAQP
jgi:hypothetical protein